MKVFIVLSVVLACAFARPYLDAPIHDLTHVAPLTYANLIHGAPIGPDGQVVDTPEVTHAKAAHAAAHVQQKINLIQEAAKSSEHHVIGHYDHAPVAIAPAAHLAYPLAYHHAPLGYDGNVIDTPEVAHAKAAHSAAHINEQLKHQTAELASHEFPLVVSAYTAPIGHSYIH